MNYDDLQRIEQSLGRPLPETFRRVMLKFPQVLVDDAIAIDDEGHEFLDCMMISPDAEALLAGLEHYQAQPSWPQHFVVVGENGCGEVYCVDISQANCPVFECGPHNEAGAQSPNEAGYFEPLSPDLDSWVREMVRLAEARANGANPFEQAINPHDTQNGNEPD